LIYNNTTRYGGGAYCRLNATPAFIYCTFYGNSARNDGGGIYCHGATPILTGTNIAFSDGDGIYFQNSSGSSIEYCNLFGNNTGDFSFFNHDPSHGPTSIGALTTLNANSDSCDMYFNISEDPRFVNTAAEDFHLDEYSRCIGAANPANPTPTDMDGNPRPNPPGSHPDIGPYESGLNSPAPLEGLAGALNGTLGPGTYSVVDVISISAEDSLRLLPGTILSFTGAYAFNIYGRLLAEGTENDSIIFTTDTIANPERWRDLRFFETTSSPSRLAYCRIENGYQPGYHGKGGSVYCENSSPSFIHCHYSDNKAAAGGAVYCGTSSAPVFENCTFTNNSADDWGGYGGAVYCSESSPSFMNCSFTNNSAGDGGAINCDENSSPDFTNCRIRNNFAYVGSGVYCFNSSSSFAECTINHNFCDDTFWGGYGGGVYGYHSSVTFEDCTIDSNAVYGEGGGILCYKSSMEFNRCTICNNIVGNEYDGYGGAIMCFDSAFVSLTNCVLASNQAGVGGGIYCSWASLDLTNCTLYNNSNTGIYCYSNYALTINSTIVAFCGDYGIYFGGDSIQSQILYCDFHGNGGLFLNDFGGQVPNNLSIITTTNTNNDSCDIFYNIYSDPSFADINTNDFHLADFSRCIGAGDAISCPETDIEGNPRPNPPDSHPDIGAFENPRGTPLDVNTPPSNLLPPTEYALHPNWPNPFNPITTFSYDVKQTSHVRIIIYNLLGQETARLIDEQLPSGSYRVAWNAANLPSGLYLCQMEAGDFVQTQKMMLLK
ncbi:right-handed parallel beta-helix repeat-containing protein, partial [bacterium]|nr:right-handed parallel beta-helix repeat-containing protein [bacterium]